MDMNIRTHKHSQAFSIVATGYSGMTKFIHLDNYVDFSWEGHNFSFTKAEFPSVE